MCCITLFLILQAHTGKCAKFPVNCPNGCNNSIPREMVIGCFFFFFFFFLVLRYGRSGLNTLSTHTMFCYFSEGFKKSLDEFDAVIRHLKRSLKNFIFSN